MLSNRADQWLQLGSATPKTVFDDIHQILLFLGHILVQGSSDFGITRGARYTWETQFEAREDYAYLILIGSSYSSPGNQITSFL